MIGTIVFCRLTQKGPCGMTVNNDIDDDSATKHGDSHIHRLWPACLVGIGVAAQLSHLPLGRVDLPPR